LSYASRVGFHTSVTPLRLAIIVLLYGHRSLHRSYNYRLSEEAVRGAIRLAYDSLPVSGFEEDYEQPVFSQIIERSLGTPTTKMQPISPPYLFMSHAWWSDEDESEEGASDGEDNDEFGVL
jgi:hypothetical protein